MSPFWLTDWICAGFREHAHLLRKQNISSKHVGEMNSRHFQTVSLFGMREGVSRHKQWWGVKRGCLEPFVRAHPRLAVWHLSELHREITGHSKDRWRVQSVSFTRADTHQHAPFLPSCCLMCAKVKLLPKFGRVWVACMTFVRIEQHRKTKNVSNITEAGFTVTFHCAEMAKPILAYRANWHFKILHIHLAKIQYKRFPVDYQYYYCNTSAFFEYWPKQKAPATSSLWKPQKKTKRGRRHDCV